MSHSIRLKAWTPSYRPDLLPTLTGTEVKKRETPCSWCGWGRKAAFATFLAFANTKPDKSNLRKELCLAYSPPQWRRHGGRSLARKQKEMR